MARRLATQLRVRDANRAEPVRDRGLLLNGRRVPLPGAHAGAWAPSIGLDLPEIVPTLLRGNANLSGLLLNGRRAPLPGTHAGAWAPLIGLDLPEIVPTLLRGNANLSGLLLNGRRAPPPGAHAGAWAPSTTDHPLTASATPIKNRKHQGDFRFPGLRRRISPAVPSAHQVFQRYGKRSARRPGLPARRSGAAPSVRFPDR